MRTPGRISAARAGEWLRSRDPELAATRRACRTALVMPALFALCSQVFHSRVMASYAAFASFSMLLLVEFTGPMVQRLRAHLSLAVAWAVLICLGTAAAPRMWLAVVVTVVVGFLVLFSGVVSSVLAGSATALLLAFILPVTTPAPLSQLPDRLAGAGLAAAAATLAICLLWPRPAGDPVAPPAARVCRAAAEQLRTEAAYLDGGSAAPDVARCRAAADGTEAAAADLRRAFDATPYRPTGLSATSRALVRLVDELTWLHGILNDTADYSDGLPRRDVTARAARRAAADVLDAAAGLLGDLRADTSGLRSSAAALRSALDRMEDSSTTRLPAARPGTVAEVYGFLTALDLSFRAHELGFAVLQIAANVQEAAAAEQRSWPERLLGLEPDDPTGPLAAAAARAKAHLERHSLWLHNSLRGAVGLGIAVALADVTSVQHSFWVLLGTLSVLRSNALNTGQNAVRAIMGTVVGSVVGAGLLRLIGHHGTVLWFLLPLAVLLTGIAPAVISFAAGQAAFTVTLVVLFNIDQNPDWHIVLLRIEDIALGCGVSVLVALFFWPRGAAAAVDHALADAYTDSARYLTSTVEYAVGSASGPIGPEQALRAGQEAAASARRLDDAFRNYLAERGSKPLPLADMTTLVTGVVGLRLAADAVLSLWRHADDPRPGAERAEDRHTLLAATTRVTGWFTALAATLEDHTALPDPVESDPALATRLADAIFRAMHGDQARAATAVRLIWTRDHLDAARRLQPSLAAAVTGRAGERSPAQAAADH
ncbi:FUSC family protein [Streptomyces sp. NBC_00820]|uniref:FUSC family protein n=1 Tax=Streptomyces sp. NBC_00820 TaxID=2975842 RepID=UPI002ED646EF|nr:FUSC family protein [Streptomyces sp. NBC_00820]